MTRELRIAQKIAAAHSKGPWGSRSPEAQSLFRRWARIAIREVKATQRKPKEAP